MGLEQFQNPDGKVDERSLRQASRNTFSGIQQTLEETHGKIEVDLGKIFRNEEEKKVA
ncbi:hypothetical protein ACFL21_04110 [Patescibacteria group bacterium]